MNAHIRQTERKNSSHFAIWIALILLIMVNFSTSTNMINFSLSSSTVQTALQYSRSESPVLKAVPVPPSPSVDPLPGALNPQGSAVNALASAVYPQASALNPQARGFHTLHNGMT